MDEAVLKFYRVLLRTRFEHAGSFDNASIFVDSVNEDGVGCGAVGNVVRLYANILDNTITDIKYTCSCDPTANVAIEILCAFMKGKTLTEAAQVTDDMFIRFLGSDSEELRKKARNMLELMNRGIARYKAQTV